MAMVTNGRVVYVRRVRTGDFEHKEATVELSFAAGPNGAGEETIREIAQMAMARAEAMVGVASAASGLSRSKLAKPPVVAKTGSLVASAIEATVAPASTPAADPAAVTEADASEPPIDDAKLVEHIMHVQARIANGPAIRALIAEFAGAPPKRAPDVPQDRRKEFLVRLEKLPPLK